MSHCGLEMKKKKNFRILYIIFRILENDSIYYSNAEFLGERLAGINRLSGVKGRGGENLIVMCNAGAKCPLKAGSVSLEILFEPRDARLSTSDK